MHLQQQLNVLPTKKEAIATGIMAIPTGQTTLVTAVAALRLLRATLLSEGTSNTRVLDRRRREPRSAVLSRSRGLRGPDTDQGAMSTPAAEGQEEQRRKGRILSDGSLLRRCPVDVLVGVCGWTDVGGRQSDLCGRGGRGKGLSRLPGQNPRPATTGDVAGGGDRSVTGQCMRVDAASGGSELERGSACDRLSHVAMDRLGHANGCPEADAELSEWQGPSLHLLQSEPLVSGTATR